MMLYSSKGSLSVVEGVERQKEEVDVLEALPSAALLPGMQTRLERI
jgi:hypothetical protein